MTIKFSSPLGDGLVRYSRHARTNLFMYFRPRVGMGWFSAGTD